MPLKINGIRRIIDANLNRTKEGLRVCEEITRFMLNNRSLTSGFKKIRHRINNLVRHISTFAELIKERQSQKDIGRTIYINELKRDNYRDIFFANIQRVKESIRVLEEFSKLKDSGIAKELKKIRYNLYELEKKAAGRLLSLCRHR